MHISQPLFINPTNTESFMRLKITFLTFLFSFLFFQSNAQCFEEQDGIVVVEVESGNFPSGWRNETGSVGTGFTGSSFAAYRGENLFNSPGGNVIEYTIRINTPGEYRFQWRNRIGIIDPAQPTTEHNDSFLSILGTANNGFFARRGSSVIFPRGSGLTPNPQGSSGNRYFKVNTTSLGWNWTSFTNDGNGHIIYARFDTPGDYTLRIAGRSNGHLIDRFVLFDESRVSFASATNTSRAETRCGGSAPPPPPPTDDTPPPPPPADDPEVSSIQYINANTETVLGTLTSGTQINLSNINNAELSFRALTDPSSIGSVVFDLTGPRNFSRTDNGAPYTLVGEGGSNFFGLSLPVGNYTLRTTPFSGSNRTGNSGTVVSINFSVVTGAAPPPPPPPTDEEDDTPPPPPPSDDGLQISGFQYVNTDQDIVLGTLTNNIQINLADINNAEISIIAQTATSSIGSVRFQLVGPRSFSRTENGSAPYTLVGDAGSNFYGVSLPVGSYTVTATPYSGSNRTGNNGNPVSVNFSVVNDDNTPPPPPADDEDDTPPPTDDAISFLLINAANNSFVTALENGNVINRNTALNIRASTSISNVGSMVFNVRGGINTNTVENTAPFAVFGDNNGDYFSRNFPNGLYTITATAYSGTNRTGRRLGQRSVSFRVRASSNINSTIATPLVFPNPVVNGKFAVQMPEEVSGEIFYSILSSAGVEIEVGKINASSSTDNLSFEVPRFNSNNSGIYYMVIQSSTFRHTIPLMVR